MGFLEGSKGLSCVHVPVNLCIFLLGVLSQDIAADEVDFELPFVAGVLKFLLV